MERIGLVSRECFNAVVQVRRADAAGLPPPEVLHRSLRRAVNDLLARGAQLGLGRDDVDDIAYAVVALADEVVAAKSESLAAYWAGHSLAQEYFRDPNAGEGFFTRLAGVRQDGARRREVLQAYGLALLLGFQGRYRFRGRELELLTLQEDVHEELLRGRRRDGEQLSPGGERPDGAGQRGARSGRAWWAALGAAALAALLYAGMTASLASGVDGVRHRVGAELRLLGLGGGR